MVWVWVMVFAASLIALVKGSGWLLSSAEKIGLAIGLSPFIIGVTIIAIGTSFPELIYALTAVLRGVREVAVANAVGSNVANIFLVVGISALIAGKLVVKKDLINIDLPLLATSTALFLAVAWDREVVLFESLLLLLAYAIYILYTIFEKEERDLEKASEAIIPPEEEDEDSVAGETDSETRPSRPKLSYKVFLSLVFGIAGLFLGARYLTESVIKLSELLDIGAGVITITAVAIGTSLPELAVSLRAVRQGKPELVLGNILGSCIFNILVIVGIPGLFTTLTLDEKTFAIGLPVMIMAVVLFIVAGISRRIYRWESSIFLIIYFVFIAKLFNLF